MDGTSHYTCETAFQVQPGVDGPKSRLATRFEDASSMEETPTHGEGSYTMKAYVVGKVV